MRTYMLAVCGVVLGVVAQAAPGPCGLVTKAEVQEAVGSPVSDGTLNKTNQTVCDYRVGATGSSVGIMLTTKSSADSADKTVAALKKSKITAQLVPGIGEGAYASSPGYGMQQLGAFKGSNHVIVTVLIMGAPEAKSKAVAEKVMRKALAKL